MDYPIWNPSIGGGVLIGIVAILHVVVSHFAIGGGITLGILETLAVRNGDRAFRELARRGSWLLVLVSTVFGAISGVAIWFTIGLVQPAATSSLIHTFVWGWAIEWGFFLLEIVTALAYVATWDKVRPRTHLVIIWLYAFAAFMSLVVIQGILAFMLTPGRWIATGSFWDGFLNPSYVPGIVFRTGACLLLAGGYLTLSALRERDRDARARAVRLLSAISVAGAILAALGGLWWERSLPDGVTRFFLGAKPLLASLAATRHLVLWALAASAALFLLTALLPRLQNWGLAVVALLAAFAVLGGYERLREGARKPFVIRDQMFSNGVLVSEIDKLNRDGILSKARWGPLERTGKAETGRAVFRAECSSCHTLDGYLGIRKIVEPMDADLATMFLTALRDDGAAWKALRAGDATAKPGYPMMPPFVGTDAELDALARYLVGLNAQKVAEASRAR